jgi:threonylcarbamoyladenosine tRNA methylthiotransferase MtaB
MARFSIENFGCRATEADSSVLRSALLARGLTLTPDHSAADVVVLNTCTVTQAADAEARQVIRKIHRINPSARIVVTGCYAQRAPEELAALEGVSWVVGNSHQSEIPSLVGDTPSPAAPGRLQDFFPLAELSGQILSAPRPPAKIVTSDISADSILPMTLPAPPERDRTRPILKIQDGCNHRCSYCVIPFVRGPSRSVPPDQVVLRVRGLISQGAKEIVLSGINLGSYGRDLEPRATLTALVRRILEETTLDQVRLSSIEPQHITVDFVCLVASSDRIAPHFHVPLQSGSDRILRAMHRWYRTGHYAERIGLIHHMAPHAAIGADVIVGFPGETREDFDATARLVSELPFTYLHVFSFSARPGTQAERLPDPLPAAEIRGRARALRALGHEKSDRFRASQAGRTLRALTLARSEEDWTEALTGNYLRVRIAGRPAANQWHEVSLPPPCPAGGAG